MRQIPLLFALLSTLPAAFAQIGLNSLPEVEFSQLSQRDPNPLGERALSINPTQWKHGETEHYIYHFAHSYVATPISVAAVSGSGRTGEMDRWHSFPGQPVHSPQSRTKIFR